MMDYNAAAQHLGGMIGNRGKSPKKPGDIRAFLQTPAGQEAARAAVEGVIGASQTQPLPIPTYKAILKTIEGQMSTGEMP